MKLLLSLVLSFLLPLGTTSRGLSVPQLVQQLQKQQRFNYLLIVAPSAESRSQLWWHFNLPIILLDPMLNISHHKLNKLESSNMMSVVYVAEPAESSLEFLSLNLGVWTTSPILLILRKGMQVAAILEWCWQQKQLLNALAIYEDFEETGLLYSYSPFPIFKFDERRIDNWTNPILIPYMQNLQGYRLPIVLGGSPPRLTVYRRKDGQLVFNGYVGHLMHCFEKKHNCRLTQVIPMNESSVIPALTLVDAVRSGKVQLALAPTFTEPPFNGYTYPFELVNWCLMLPVPGLVPRGELYRRVMNLPTFLTVLGALVMISMLLSISLWRHGYKVQADEFLLHYNCLRGALGQSFNEVPGAPIFVRGIYLEICTFGFLITAWYNSYYSAYITSGPREKPFSSFDDILESNYKIIMWTPEYQQLIKNWNEFQYASIFKLEPDYERFLKLRDSYNTQFGYIIPLVKWNIFHQQQKLFTSPLFTFREDLCVNNIIPIGFPMAPNSIYREPLDRMIGEVTATGLMVHWRDMAFSEMITAGKLNLADLGKSNKFRAMQLMDLNYILRAAALMMSLAFIVFLLEQLWFWKRHKL